MPTTPRGEVLHGDPPASRHLILCKKTGVFACFSGCPAGQMISPLLLFTCRRGHFTTSHSWPFWRKVGQGIYKITGKGSQNSECEKTLLKIRDSYHTGLNQKQPPTNHFSSACVLTQGTGSLGMGCWGNGFHHIGEWAWRVTMVSDGLHERDKGAPWSTHVFLEASLGTDSSQGASQPPPSVHPSRMATDGKLETLVSVPEPK